MNEFVPPCWHDRDTSMTQPCQQGGTVMTIGWYKPSNGNIVYIEARNTKYSPVQ